MWMRTITILFCIESRGKVQENVIRKECICVIQNWKAYYFPALTYFIVRLGDSESISYLSRAFVSIERQNKQSHMIYHICQESSPWCKRIRQTNHVTKHNIKKKQFSEYDNFSGCIDFMVFYNVNEIDPYCLDSQSKLFSTFTDVFLTAAVTPSPTPVLFA